jgi:regulator of protease activity HflC (stomatin/prohibitin superfamily)
MASARDLLQRFRPAGAPGPATAAGVPADRVEERAAELEPLFLLLEDAVAEAARIRRDAEVEAERRRTQAREQAVARVAAGRLEADSIRAAALAEAQRAAAVAATLSAEQARAVAEDIARRSRRTVEVDVVDVVARVRAALGPVPDRSPT